MFAAIGSIRVTVPVVVNRPMTRSPSVAGGGAVAVAGAGAEGMVKRYNSMPCCQDITRQLVCRSGLRLLGLDEQLQRRQPEVGAVGRPRDQAAFLVAADDADHRAVAGVAVVVGDPGTAAGAVPEGPALELHGVGHRLVPEAVRGAADGVVLGVVVADHVDRV